MASPGDRVLTAFVVLVFIWILAPFIRTSHSVQSLMGAGNSTVGPFNATDAITAENDLLVMYAYHETDNALTNANFFLQHGLHAAADFIFIINGASLLERQIPVHLPNVKVALRTNNCFDLGAHGAVLLEEDRALIKRYKKFILLNASIRGPFTPRWADKCWSDVYQDLVTDTVKLAAMTFNCPGHHLNSMIYATDQIGATTLVDGCMGTCFENMESAVSCEQQATPTILDAGYEIDSLMAAYLGEFDGSNEAYRENCRGGDVNTQNGYHGFNVHPYDTLFVKANRNIDPTMLQKFTQWHNTMNRTSWDTCHKKLPSIVDNPEAHQEVSNWRARLLGN
ncbi:hypothetical protein BP5796_00710 [Coleophoma crateriformis]|uniref:Uncharacterized protein n=1 Tax=Coleophoma crateriformis TaxID=565419 RepID=A0A3D8T8V0_9HELO|nr:hypothetical protein BP5796_00710 [Coleophoma crateriformis]